MALEPAFELPKVTAKSFDKTCCLFCQKIVPEKTAKSRGKPLKITSDDFEDFRSACADHFRYETNKYTELHAEIKDKTGEQLKTEGYCFHSDCRRTFNRDKIVISRKRKAEEDLALKEVEERMKPSRILRTNAGDFDFMKCLFCQENNQQALYDIRQDSKDADLKLALEECPSSLQIYNIRSLAAHDAMAGELKYHNDCWRNIIYKRVPEITIDKAQGVQISPFNHPTGDQSSSGYTFRPRSHDEGFYCPADDDGFDDFHIIHDDDEYDDDDDYEASLNPIPSSDVSTQNVGEPSETSIDVELPVCQTTGVQEIVISDLMRGIELALCDNQVLTVRNVVDVYKNRMEEYGLAETRNYKTIRKMIVRNIMRHIPDVSLDQSLPSQSQRITTKNMEKLILRLAEDKCKDDETEVGLLKKAASILRRKTMDFMKENPTNFDGSIENERKNCPEILFSFFKWMLTGDRRLKEALDGRIESLSQTTCFNIMFNIKTERQASYGQKNALEVRSRHRYIPAHHIGMGLSLRNYDRNNAVVRLLSAPSFGLSITPRQCLRWETAIANSVIDNMAVNGNVYIPPNLVKNVVPMFHIDNIDWLEDTPDGKNTTHMLIICTFQKKVKDRAPLSMILDQKTVSLTLKENTFGELLQCNKPSKFDFLRTSGCSSFLASNIRVGKIGFWKMWCNVRSMERIFLKEVSADVNEPQNDESTNGVINSTSIMESEQNDENLLPPPANNFQRALEKLVLPSFGATNSLVCNVDTTLTNIFSSPLIPGPASSYSAIYTALMTAKNITAWACGDTSKVVVSFDLDLYEKIYPLVNSNEKLKNRYVLCLGELHAVFAHLRAIGSFINGLGIDDAWIAAGWYDSPSLVRQVLECANMKRATRAHEATSIAIKSHILRSVVAELPEGVHNHLAIIQTLIKTTAQSVESNETDRFRSCWETLSKELDNLQLEEKITQFITKKGDCRLLQIFVVYLNMVERLFNFIEASRNRDWLLHLQAAQELMQDFCSMDRIKYRRLWAVYIAEMVKLETDEPEVWNSFLEGNFSCQKTSIPGTALGRDHTGEQMNKVLKTRGGVTGITRNDNSRNRHFLLAPVLESISEEMQNIGGVSYSESKKHHELSTSHTMRQNNSVSSLIEVFSKHGFTLECDDDEQLRNIVTGQLFQENVYQGMLNCEKVGNKLYEEFVSERLQPASDIKIFAPLKKANVKTCKTANKTKKVKVQDKIVELRSNCNLFAKCSVIKGKRDIDMKVVVGDYELMAVPRSLMTADGVLHSGHVGKSDLVNVIMKHCEVTSSGSLNLPHDTRTCAIIDAMYVVNTIIPKPSWIQTGADLAKEFLKRIDDRSKTASSVGVIFDTYRDVSLKDATRADRVSGKGKKKTPRKFQINNTTNIKKVSMSEILSTKETKRSLTTFLMKASIDHLSKRNVTYIVAGNNSTHSSFQEDVANNHEEADTLMINSICMFSPTNQIVLVHSVDTDVFSLLLRHHDNIVCEKVYMKLVSGFVDISSVYDSLGRTVSKALLCLHALTGCDTTGKFSGISKEFWTKQFLNETGNVIFINSMANLESGITNDFFDVFSSFVCKAYRFPRSPLKVTNETYDLSSTRYHLFRKSGAEGEKLPPSKGALTKHIDRGYLQLHVWSSAHLSEINVLEPSGYGWEKDDSVYLPVANDDPIAPDAIIEMVSCKLCKLCADGRCACRSTNQSCTDFCGCSEYCENTDTMMPENVLQDDEDE